MKDDFYQAINYEHFINAKENNEYTAYDYDSTIGKSTKAIITSSRPKYGMGSNEVLGIAGSDLSIVPPALTEALSKLPTESNITVYKYSDSDNLNMPYLKSDSPIMQLNNVVSDSNLSKPTKANISEIPSILDNATIKEALATGDFDKYNSEMLTNTKYTLGGHYYSIKNAWEDSDPRTESPRNQRNRNTPHWSRSVRHCRSSSRWNSGRSR